MWGSERHKLFDNIKRYLATPPMLIAPKLGTPFWLYMAGEQTAIGTMLAQEIEGKEHVVLSQSKTD